MRKKYLSALLFGALLVTSAGTFTSCKDYDDEINGLQEQINTINTTLSELKDQISGGVSSVTFDEATGVLTVVDGSETKTYTIKTASEAMCEAVIKDGVLYLNEKEVGPVVGEVKVDGNKLIVDGKEIAEIGSKVVLVKNLDEGTCDLTVDNETVTLPLASANVSVVSWGYRYFANLSSSGNGDAYDDDDYYVVDNSIGINWGDARNYKGEWGGSKSVAKGQLLVGKINSVSVKVNPATFDLTTAKLKLVNTLGEFASVTVTPVASKEEGPLAGGSRAASETGVWKLEIAMDETVTTDNIGSVFASKDGKYNVNYALAVNGTVVSDYSFYIDTDEEPTTSVQLLTADNLNYKAADGKYYAYNDLPLGTTEVEFDNNSSNDNVYDSYIEIVDIDKAEAAGITAEGMKIIAPNTEAASKVQSLTIRVHVLYVDGTVDDETIETKVSFGNVVADDVKDLGTIPYTLMPNVEGIIVDLKDTFTGLTAEEADKISGYWYNGGVTFALDDEFNNKTLNTISNNGVNAVKYYTTLEDAQKGENAVNVTNGEVETIRTIKYAVISNDDIKDLNNGIPTAEAGENKFTLTLTDYNPLNGNKNEIKKVTGILNVTVPTFEELFDKTTDKAWDGNVLSVNIDNTGKGTLPAAFKAKNASYSFTLAGIEAVEVDMMTYDKATAANATGSLTIETEAVDENGVLVPFNVIATYPVAGGKLIAKSSEFTIKTVSPLEGAQILNYDADGKSVEFFANSTSLSLNAATSAGTGKPYKNGVALKVGSTTIGLNNSNTIENPKDHKVTFSTSTAANATTYNVTAKFDAAAGDNAQFAITGTGIEVTNLKEGEYVTVMTLTVEHASGVKTVIPVSITVNTNAQ